MTRKLIEMAPEHTLQLFERADTFTLAGTDPQGRSILRTLHGVVREGALYFHGSKKGEKAALAGREVVAQSQEVVATLPSYFFDPNKACPATTYYRSAQLRGRLEAIDEPSSKARVLSAIMEKYQPEGGYVPLAADDERYAPALRAIGVMRIVPVELLGRAKLGQHRSAAQMEKALDGLWRRGADGDLAAIGLISDAHPEKLRPSFLNRLEGERARALRPLLAPAAGPGANARIEEVVLLLRDQYWNEEVSDEQLRIAHRKSHWLALVDPLDGSLVASARAITDDAKYAQILDVVVRQDERAKGVGHALLRLLLDHRRVRDCRSVFLSTRDAMTFYGKHAFGIHRPCHTAMRLHRGPCAGPEVGKGPALPT